MIPHYCYHFSSFGFQLLVRTTQVAGTRANGNDWTHHSGWMTSQDPCTWYGITCGSHNWPQLHVTHIHLQNNNLNGTIPHELGALTDLVELWLNENVGYPSTHVQIMVEHLDQCTNIIRIECD